MSVSVVRSSLSVYWFTSFLSLLVYSGRFTCHGVADCGGHVPDQYCWGVTRVHTRQSRTNDIIAYVRGSSADGHNSGPILFAAKRGTTPYVGVTAFRLRHHFGTRSILADLFAWKKWLRDCWRLPATPICFCPDCRLRRRKIEAAEVLGRPKR